MDYEILYKNALERAKKFIEENPLVQNLNTWIKETFPELKEESEDEKVRKALIEMVRDRTGDELWVDYNVHKEEVLAWLEKQGEQKPILNVPTREVILAIWDLGNEWKELTNGCISTEYGTQLDYIQKHWQESEYYLREKQDEQKPTIEMKTPEESLGIDSGTYNKIVDECIYGEQKSINKIEAKFKVDDWVVDNCGYVWKTEGILNQFYILEGVEGGESRPTIEWVNKTFHFWTIQDAKDGDVLASELCDSIILFKGIKDNNIDFYCDYDFSKIDIPGDRFAVNNGQHYGSVEDSKDFHPATKEQRDLLFQKMNEVGYEWDADKKELKKISQRMISAEAKEAMYDKPAWSEEDEKIFNKIIRKLDESDNVNHYDYTDFEMWLIDLKERLINI